MITMVGQKRLLSIINSYSLETLPKTLMLIGLEGCGKSLVSHNLAERLGLELVDITQDLSEDFSFDKLSEYLYCPIRKIYRLNIYNFSEKTQNKLLKFIEEPSTTVNIIIEARTEIGILPTILSRSIKLYFDDYTEEELLESQWLNSDLNTLALKICKTPAALKSVDSDSVNSLFDLCNNIVDKVQMASYSNFLSLITKINYKEDYDKFDFDLFLNALEYCAYQKYIKDDNDIASIILDNLTNYRVLFNKSNNASKEPFMINLFTSIWEEIHK